jgi:hypothetical protein
MQLLKYFIERIYKVKSMLNNYVQDDINIFQKFIILVDLALSIVIYGSGITDYFQYQFYKRSHFDRKNFIVHRKRMWLVRNLNDKNDRKTFDCKAVFNKLFNDYLGRQWLDPSESSFEDFCDFAEKNDQFLVKPLEGSHGMGIRIEFVEQGSDLEALYKTLQSEQMLVEELIAQNSELAEFNPSSVNTLRVVTLLNGSGKVNIMTANLRMGNGEDRFADNFHHNGIAALLDVDTGLIVTPGVDKKLQKYIFHPASGKQIIGFRVPYWAEIIEMVNTAAQIVPTVRYIGWDVAIGKDGKVLLIEGNAAADPDISQMPDQIGKWPLYHKVIKGTKAYS